VLGDRNIGIGYLAGTGLTSGSENIAIGYNTQLPSPTGNSQLNIGNWIYGTGGNIGIGVASPVAKLDVNGAVKVGNDATACTGVSQY
jgi:hypothetical protein